MNVRRQIGRWLVGGIPASTLFYVAFLVLTRVGRVPYDVATVISLVLSATLNFLIQKFWAFEDKEIQTIPGQSIKFFGLTMGYFLAITALVVAFVELLQFRDWIALLSARIVLATASFLITRKIFAS